MSPLLESICLLDGQPQLLTHHQQRLSDSIAALWPGCAAPDLLGLLPAENAQLIGKAKWRLAFYPDRVEQTINAYSPKMVKRLRLVEVGAYDYTHKYLDRNFITALSSQSTRYEDVIMVKNGWITDSSYANLVLEKSGEYFTPAEPLLAGVKRRYLIEQGLLKLVDIRPDQLPEFDGIHLINAMLDLGEMVIPVDQVY